MRLTIPLTGEPVVSPITESVSTTELSLPLPLLQWNAEADWRQDTLRKRGWARGPQALRTDAEDPCMNADADRWKQIEEICREALTRHSRDREAFLEAACGRRSQAAPRG